MELTEELKKELYSQGASLVGIGDMSPFQDCDFKTGIAVAVPIPSDIVIDLQTAPTKEYDELYHVLNEKLNKIVMAGEDFLRSKGFEAYAQTTDRVKVDEDNISKLPHKTVAARAGIGWIGKNCLLVTPAFGSAIRISSLLTDAPLTCDEPVTESQCGKCSVCVQECPAQALNGTLWEAGMRREEIVDVRKCYEKQVEIMYRETGIQTDLCGKCFAVCTYTRKYLKRAGSDTTSKNGEVTKELIKDGN